MALELKDLTEDEQMSMFQVIETMLFTAQTSDGFTESIAKYGEKATIYTVASEIHNKICTYYDLAPTVISDIKQKASEKDWQNLTKLDDKWREITIRTDTGDFGKNLCSTVEDTEKLLKIKLDLKNKHSNSSCFIATAAYSADSYEVNVLRSYRDKILENKIFGEWFIKSYYKISPPIAVWIKDSEIRKSITRFMLKPIIDLVEYYLKKML